MDSWFRDVGVVLLGSQVKCEDPITPLLRHYEVGQLIIDPAIQSLLFKYRMYINGKDMLHEIGMEFVAGIWALVSAK